jgi:hypothetical protein
VSPPLSSDPGWYTNSLARAGVHFALYPDTEVLGKQLAEWVLQPKPHHIEPLRTVKRAINRRFAEHPDTELKGETVELYQLRKDQTHHLFHQFRAGGRIRNAAGYRPPAATAKDDRTPQRTGRDHDRCCRSDRDPSARNRPARDGGNRDGLQCHDG